MTFPLLDFPAGAPDEIYVARAIQRQRTARAPGTNRNYITAVRQYIDYCNKFACNPRDISVQQVCVFIEHLADHLSAPGSVINYISLVRKCVADCQYPNHNWYAHRVKLALDAVARDKSHTPLQRPIIAPQVLYAVFKYMAGRPRSTSMRLILAILYFTALRQSEVILHAAKQFDPTRHLTAADIYLTGGKLCLLVKHAKNMAGHNQRRTVAMAQTGDPLTCPITLYKDMRATMPLSPPTAPAFQHPDGSPILVAHVTAALRSALAAQGLDSTTYTLHSLRRTATTHAHDARHNELDLRNSAAWSSTAYRTYVQTDSQSRVNQTLVNSLHHPHISY